MADNDNYSQDGGEYSTARPNFHLGQHDSTREEPLNDMQYGQVLNAGITFVTSPVTNKNFHSRVVELAKAHLALVKEAGPHAQSLADPIIPPLTPMDTALFPSPVVNTYIAYTSPWIDLASTNPVIANISRQVLNLEVATQLLWRQKEPGLEEKIDTLSVLLGEEKKAAQAIDVYSTWDSWHVIRTICEYSLRLFVALRIPKVLPEREVQEKWFAEPLHYLTLRPETFKKNASGHPALPKTHQDLLFSYMRLKNAPWLLLVDTGPDLATLDAEARQAAQADFPALGETPPKESEPKSFRAYIEYLKWLEFQQPPLNYLERTTLTSFQDWLQSPLQPLSDNLESATYEIFEAVVIAVAGSGRGPLVTRALKAANETGVAVEVWAVEKNPNAYVYLLRQNELVWGGRVTVVKTDMRAWKGPLVSGTPDNNPVYGKVDILVSELLGSFADNELSPECLDGVQHVLAPHGISIPESYTAHMTPVAHPRIHSDLLTRLPTDPNAFETPWVVRLFAMDFAAAEKVPGHPRFQQAWEFEHPLPEATMQLMEARRAGGVMGGGGGSMASAAGANDHNSRFCHLTFVCRTRGVIHGLAGYFESVLYAPRLGDKAKVEISTHPDQIDQKSKDMISWFPIYFPIKQPLYYPADTELEVSMWRQTDDSKVWYEWLIEAYTWVGEGQRIKVGSSELTSSRKVACLM
ncbi:arginine N-methyltransferase skb1 [Verticillium alfalfae VaMs.102]|uniref:Protein arginine N-methyltransferase n=1 Tax=Verticillium alfalfae (strain VaMs.102 / ATCC MYA-4576 / FGSC 10136) TaxID=526221 RepID=C9SAJ2_VERA1|nr:arginine N-methyltransferase skb1 [Verticillium alfalfae VaMs.102]EEY15440.1 arginine N-methyltransferase skb1 [Verticillium alfalfae VaMs.102]